MSTKEVEGIRHILIKFATKNYDKHRRTILCSFDSKQLNNVAQAIAERLEIDEVRIEMELGARITKAYEQREMSPFTYLAKAIATARPIRIKEG